MQWATLAAEMVTARQEFGAAMVDHTIYIVGGFMVTRRMLAMFQKS